MCIYTAVPDLIMSPTTPVLNKRVITCTVSGTGTAISEMIDSFGYMYDITRYGPDHNNMYKNIRQKAHEIKSQGMHNFMHINLHVYYRPIYLHSLKYTILHTYTYTYIHSYTCIHTSIYLRTLYSNKVFRTH